MTEQAVESDVMAWNKVCSLAPQQRSAEMWPRAGQKGRVSLAESLK